MSAESFPKSTACFASLAAGSSAHLVSAGGVAGQGRCTKLHSRVLLLFLYCAALYLKHPSGFFFSLKTCGCCLFRMSLFFQLASPRIVGGKSVGFD